MNARELRIGNWVNTLSGDIQIIDLMTVENKVGAKTKLFTNGITFNIDTLEPVPITEEWLVKLGFEPHGGIHFHSFNNGGYIAIGNDGSCGLYNNLSSYNRGTSFNQLKDVDFVHQLQNLYFALTGEELTLSPCQ